MNAKRTKTTLLTTILILSIFTVAIPVNASVKTYHVEEPAEAIITKTNKAGSVEFKVEIISDNPAHWVYGIGIAISTSIETIDFHVTYQEDLGEAADWYYVDYDGGWATPILLEDLDTGIIVTGQGRPEGPPNSENPGDKIFTVEFPIELLGGPGATYYFAIQFRTNLCVVYPEGLNLWSQTDATNFDSVGLLVLNQRTGIFYETIQSAITASSPDDTVLVYPGIYNEDVTIDKSLTLLSVEGKENTIINGQLGGQAAAVRVTDGVSDVVIGDTGQGFTINAEGLAAIYLVGSGIGNQGITIRDNKLVAAGQNALLTGGSQSGHTIAENEFSGEAGQLVYVIGPSVGQLSTNVDFIGNLFSGTAPTGPALGMEATDSDIIGNTFATVTGWASLELYGDGNTITGNHFTADLLSGGLYVMDNTGTDPYGIPGGGSFDLNIATTLSTNTFLRAVTVDHPEASLLPKIWANIQDAVDAASAGDTVRVYPGTYEENIEITAGKDNLKLIGIDNPLISITSGIAIRANAPITVEGFNIQGSGRGSGTAIKIENNPASGTEENPGVFKNNKVTEVNYGVQSGDWNVHHWEFLGNDFSELRIGIGLENMMDVKVIGNSFKDYKEGVSMGWDTDTASNVEIKDNEFLGDLGEGPDRLAAIIISSAATAIDVSGNDITNSIVGVLIKNGPGETNENEGSLHLDTVHINHNNIIDNTVGVKNPASMPVDATLNFWGTIEESVIQGMVSEQVDYDPWFGQEPKIEETEPDDYTVDATYEADTIVEKTGEGTPTVSVAEFTENPETGFSNEAGKFYDVKIDDDTGVDSLTLKFYYTDADLGGIEESTLVMRWYDSDTSAWVPCSDQTLYTVSDISGYSGYIEILVTDSTYPSLSDMTGTPFGFEGEFPEVYDELCDLSVSGDVIVEAAEDVTYVYASMGDTAEITVEMDLAGYHGDIYFTLYKKVDGGLAYVEEIRTVYGIELKGSRTASWVVTQSPGDYVVWINIDLMEKVQLTGLDEALHIGPIEVVIS